MTFTSQFAEAEDTSAAELSTTEWQTDEEQQYRSAAYALIASLLRSPPDQAMLDRVRGLSQQPAAEGDEILLSMSMLGLSATTLSPASIEDEFYQLFIGLGKGELVPYASWYLTGFLMEKPLSDLREDLAHLGYQKNESVSEPEDHMAALCEVLSLMIADGMELDQQRDFFLRHLGNWADKFFNDLNTAEAAVFYKSVGRFGTAFIQFENAYLSMEG